LGAVLHVVHLVFNEGHWSSDDDAPIRRDLCRLAIDLARSLHAMLPSAPEVSGLLALLLLHDARHAARLDPAGRAVPLPEQDRSRWDRDQIAEATALLERALAQRRAGPFQIEAAIAAVHCAAETADATDWRQIAELYALLEAQRPSPTVRVNRAFAVARAEGPRAGLDLLDSAEAALDGRPYPYLPLVRGVLLAELGQTREAALELERALPLARNAQERAQIAARLQRLEQP
jgi:RNA polymerase sigma-70 factor (ECF subfamily)